MITIPVSFGELLDKITILEIKIDKGILSASEELDILQEIYAEQTPTSLIKSLKNILFTINLECWDVEDAKRRHEAEKDFDQEFIELARSVYILNDMRAEVKRKINQLTQSQIQEYKNHGDYL